MRAAVLHTLGEPARHSSHPDPEPRPGESLVRVTAAPLVPLDLLCASGTSYFGAPAVPYVPGVQGVGRIESSESLDVGTRVWFATSAGMTAGDGSLAELAALGLSGVAAWMSLTWRARFQAGERVLVLGGGGAVGQAAIGAARLLGANQVVAACRSRESADRAAAAGADEIVLTSPDPGGLVARLTEACLGHVDVVIDPVFGETAAAASQVLGEGGRLVNLGASGGDQAAFSSAALRSRSIEILGYTNNALTVEQRRTAINEISRHAALGELGVAHEVCPLDAVEGAWTRLASGEAATRLVLTPEWA